MAQAAPTLKRLHFELGGKNPVVVFDDADLERALDAVVFMIYSLNGERCTSSSRLLVQKSIEREFTERLVERVRKIKVGHPLDPATEVGPLIHREARRESARLLRRRARRARRDPRRRRAAAQGGNYVQPTVLAGAQNACVLRKRRSSGPC